MIMTGLLIIILCRSKYFVVALWTNISLNVLISYNQVDSNFVNQFFNCVSIMYDCK